MTSDESTVVGTVRHLTARFDRPFGFLAVHRPSGLIIACGWVAPQLERLPELSVRYPDH